MIMLFKQQRVGLNGENFTIYKFKTMHNGRVTPVGRVLRPTGLDELPQVINILKGDMTLVGPRPEVAELADESGIRYHRRHSVKPGMTGLWQVERPEQAGDLKSGLDLDEYYIDNKSIWLDLKIVLRTPYAILKRTGRFEYMKKLTLITGFIIALMVPFGIAGAAEGDSATTSVEFGDNTFTATSDKELSNVVWSDCAGDETKADNLSGYTFTKNVEATAVWVKSGNNKSGDGPGYGEKHVNPSPDCGDDDDDGGTTGGTTDGGDTTDGETTDGSTDGDTTDGTDGDTDGTTGDTDGETTGGDCYPITEGGCGTTTDTTGTTGTTTDTTGGDTTDGTTTDGSDVGTSDSGDTSDSTTGQTDGVCSAEDCLPVTGFDNLGWAVVGLLAVAGGVLALSLTRKD